MTAACDCWIKVQPQGEGPWLTIPNPRCPVHGEDPDMCTHGDHVAGSAPANCDGCRDTGDDDD